MTEAVPSYRLGAVEIGGLHRVVLTLDKGPALALDQPGPGGEPPVNLLAMLCDWDTWSERLDAAARRDWPTSELSEAPDWTLPRLGDKCLCIGANYTDHIGEMGVPKPPWPYSFVVPPSTALVLSGAEVAIPRGVEEWDWEAEVAVVLGRRLRYASTKEAAEAIALYTPFNDLSARDSGKTKIAFGIDMTMIKAHDDSKVLGPVFTPAQLVADPQDLRLRCLVNGEVKQDLTTRTMIYSVVECIAHLSAIMTLQPGDVIATGTGGGVGALQDPPEFLHPGDTVVVEVDGVGRTVTPIVATPAA